MMKCRPKVEIGIYILNYNCDKLLLAKNKMDIFWRILSDKLNFGESFEESACRILFEQLNFKFSMDRVKFLCSLNVSNKSTKFHWLEINYFLQINEKEELEFINLKSLYIQWKLFKIDDIFANKNEIFCGILIFLKKYNITNFNNMKNVLSN